MIKVRTHPYLVYDEDYILRKYEITKKELAYKHLSKIRKEGMLHLVPIHDLRNGSIIEDYSEFKL